MDSESVGAIVGLVFQLLILIAVVVTVWKLFVKMGLDGWKSIIPLYSLYIMLKALGRPGWWLVLYLIPIANIFVSYMVSVDLAKAFGKSTMFGVFALFLFSFVGYPILAFGNAQFKGKTIGASDNTGDQAPQKPTAPSQPIQAPTAPATPQNPSSGQQ